MASHKQRTFVVALLAAIVGVRVSASAAVSDDAAYFAYEPGWSLSSAFVGWESDGSLGTATAEAVRELPLRGFYQLGNLANLPVDVLQPAWRAMVLVLAALGAIRLARATARRIDKSDDGPPGDESWAPWVAAAVFACSPVMVASALLHPLDAIAIASIPWVLAPLVRRGWGWRRAARSSVWVGVAGFAAPLWAAGVLAAGAIAAVPRRRDEVVPFARWLLLTLVASSWWLAASVWEHRHARDVSQLLPQDSLGTLAFALGWPGMAAPLAFALVTAPAVVAVAALALKAPAADRVTVAGLLIAASIALVAVLSGLWRPAVFAGSVTNEASLVTAPALGWLAVAALLAWTPLAACAVDRLRDARLVHPADPRRGTAAVMVIVLLVLTSAATVLATSQEREPSAPGPAALRAGLAAWSDTAPAGRVLVLPPTTDPRDHLLVAQALGDRPWLARDSRPESGGAATAALDELIRRMVRGHAGAGTTTLLQRLGIAYVLLRNDPQLPRRDLEANAFARSALRQLGADPAANVTWNRRSQSEAQVLDYGLHPSVRSLEVWALPRSGDAWLYDGRPLEVMGGVGAVTALADAGLSERPLNLVDGGKAPGLIISDSARRRDLDQRVTTDPYGPTLPATESPVIVPEEASAPSTTARRIEGAAAVIASSSAADLYDADRRVGAHPLAAVDGNLLTAWESSGGTGVGQWLEVRFHQERDLSGATVVFVQNVFRGPPVTAVQVDTDSTTVEREVAPGEALALDVPGPSKTLRVTVTEVGGQTRPGDSVGIAELALPGVTVRDNFDVTGPPAAGWLLASLRGSHGSCVPVSVPSGDDAAESATTCDPSLSKPGFDAGSISRTLENRRSMTVSGTVWMRAASSESSAGLADLLARPTVRASASSALAPDLRSRAQAAVDADDTTAWRPSADDTEPELTLTWNRLSRIRGLRLHTAANLASRPVRVRVATASGRVTVQDVRPDGTVTFPPTRTRSLTITVVADSGEQSVDSLTGAMRRVPVAISEVSLLGGPQVTYDMDTVHDLPCGSGPVLAVAGRDFATAATLSARSVITGQVIRAQACGSIQLPEATVPVGVDATFTWSPLGVALLDEARGLDASRALSSDLPTGEPLWHGALQQRRTKLQLDGDARLDDGTRTLVLATPAAAGWTALSGDEELPSLVVDGWAQGWLVPPSVERVVVTYSPGGTLRVGVAVGAFAWAIVAVVALAGWVSAPRVRNASGGIFRRRF